MDLFDANANKIAIERLIEARKRLKELQEWLRNMDAFLEDQIERSGTGSFPVGWCGIMMERAFDVFNEVAKANGAALVRGKEPVVPKEGESCELAKFQC